MPRFCLPLIVVLAGTLSMYAVYSSSPSECSKDTLYSSNVESQMTIPEDLESRVLEQFDDLVKRKLMVFEPSEAEIYEADGFQWEFRQIPMLKSKPILEPTAPGRSESSGPFVDPEPAFVVTQIGHRHRLLINRYSIYRPMLVLPTISYELQTDDLNIDDMAAAWAVLKAYSSPQILIYNCGVHAGSSQGHKHLQIFPQPATGDSRLWPAKATSTTEISDRIPDVPFRHYVLRISENATAEDVHQQYLRLLVKTKQALTKYDVGMDNNVIMTRDWIALVPRRTAVWGGPLGAGAAGMIGLVTIPDQEQRDDWAARGYTKFLMRLGVPFEDD